MGHTPTLLSLLPRLFISMVIVILVMWVAARVLKNRQVPGSGRILSKSTKAGKARPYEPQAMQVLGRQGVGKGAAVTVVRVGNKTLVVGVTESRVSLLTELDSEAEEAEAIETSISEAQWTGLSESLHGTSSDPAWKGLLTQVRERTVRKY